MTQSRSLSLEDLIEDEIETIMYSCAPASVKAAARRRLVTLREQLRKRIEK